MYTKADIVRWLLEYTPHIELVAYAGKVKDTSSTFKNINTGYIFRTSVHNIKRDLKRGCDVGLSPEERLQKKQATWMRNHGVIHPKKSPIVQQKYVDTCRQKYGSDNYFSSKEWLDKASDVYIDSLGVSNPFKHPNVIQKAQITNMKRYGTPTFAQSVAQCWEGQTIVDIEQATGLSRATIYKHLHAGILPSNISSGGTYIEDSIKQFLQKENITYVKDRQLFNLGIRPDFYLPEYNVVIECDGLYYHSDAFLENPEYHMIRKKLYSDNGVISLFFREDEIRYKLPIVKSIVLHKAGKSCRIFARNSILHNNISKTFFEENHLMGNGSGRTYALLNAGVPISGIQVKWKNKHKGLLEISRFCYQKGYTVVGGFSKLLKHVIAQERPKIVVTFIDKRYGDGSYLNSLGFDKTASSVSFRWTKNLASLHRMRFPGNTGYKEGFRKIWDCGQDRWEYKV